MIIFAPQEFITWTKTLVQFSWPIQLNDFLPYAEQLGWKPTSLPDEFTVFPDNDYEFTTLSSTEWVRGGRPGGSRFCWRLGMVLV